MTQPTQRRARRPAALLLVLVTLLGLPLLSAPVGADAIPFNPRAAVFQQYVDAVSRTDPDAAQALFADNAVFIGTRASGPCSQSTPCTDRASLGAALRANAMVHPCFTLREIQVTGGVVTGRYEIRADPYPSLGVERVINSFIAYIPQGKIVALYNVADYTDSQTATYLAVTSGAQAPTPLSTPRLACSDVGQSLRTSGSAEASFIHRLGDG